MATTERRANTLARLRTRDPIALYASTRATTDGVARLVGAGFLPEPPRRQAVTVAGRHLDWIIPLDLRLTLPLDAGLPFAPLVDDLDWLPNKDTWRFKFMGAIAEIPDKDVLDLHDRMADWAVTRATP